YPLVVGAAELEAVALKCDRTLGADRDERREGRREGATPPSIHASRIHRLLRSAIARPLQRGRDFQCANNPTTPMLPSRSANEPGSGTAGSGPSMNSWRVVVIASTLSRTNVLRVSAAELIASAKVASFR